MIRESSLSGAWQELAARTGGTWFPACPREGETVQWWHRDRLVTAGPLWSRPRDDEWVRVKAFFCTPLQFECRLSRRTLWDRLCGALGFRPEHISCGDPSFDAEFRLTSTHSRYAQRLFAGAEERRNLVRLQISSLSAERRLRYPPELRVLQLMAPARLDLELTLLASTFNRVLDALDAALGRPDDPVLRAIHNLAVPLNQLAGSSGKVLHWDGPAVQARAVAELGAARDPRAIEPLARLLDTDSLSLRAAVLRSLAEIADARATPAVLPYLGDFRSWEGAPLPGLAHEALRRFGREHLAGPFLRSLAGEEAAWDGVVWGPPYVQAAVLAIRTGTPEQVLAAARLLGDHGAAEALPHLRRATLELRPVDPFRAGRLDEIIQDLERRLSLPRPAHVPDLRGDKLPLPVSQSQEESNAARPPEMSAPDRPTGPQKSEVWRRFCREVDADWCPGGVGQPDRIQVRRGDWLVTLDTASSPDGRAYLRYRAPFVNWFGFRFSLQTVGRWAGVFWKATGAKPIHFGGEGEREEPTYYSLTEEPGSLSRVLGDPYLRELVRQERPHLIAIQDDERNRGVEYPPGVDLLVVHVHASALDPKRLHAGLRLFLQLTERVEMLLDRPGDRAARLIQDLQGPSGVIRQDPHVLWDGGEERARAARELGRLRSRRAIPALAAATCDAYQPLRAAAIEALQEIGDPAAVTTLVPLLGDLQRVGETTLSERAARALHTLGEGDLADRFLAVVTGRASAGSLCGPQRPLFVQALLRALRAGDSEEVLNAAVALGDLEEVRALPGLREALARHPHRRSESAARLARIIAALEARQSLPHPASAPPPDPDTLPLPAETASPDPTNLPLPRS